MAMSDPILLAIIHYLNLNKWPTDILIGYVSNVSNMS